VDEAPGDVEAEAQQPQDQNDCKDRPEHFLPFLSTAAPFALTQDAAHMIRCGLVRSDGLSFCTSNRRKKSVRPGGHCNFTLQDFVIGDVMAVDGPGGIFVVADGCAIQSQSGEGSPCT